MDFRSPYFRACKKDGYLGECWRESTTPTPMFPAPVRQYVDDVARGIFLQILFSCISRQVILNDKGGVIQEDVGFQI